MAWRERAASLSAPPSAENRPAAQKNAAAPSRDGRIYCPTGGGRLGSKLVDTLGVDRRAVRQRLHRFAGQLD